MDKGIEIIFTEQGLNAIRAHLSDATDKVNGFKKAITGLNKSINTAAKKTEKALDFKITLNGVGTEGGEGALGDIGRLNRSLAHTKSLLHDIKRIRAFSRFYPSGNAGINPNAGGSRSGGGGGGGGRFGAPNRLAQGAAGMRVIGGVTGAGVFASVATPLAGLGSMLGPLGGAASIAATSVLTLSVAAGMAANKLKDFAQDSVSIASSVEASTNALKALRSDGQALSDELRSLAQRTAGLDIRGALEMGARFAATGASKESITRATSIAARASQLSGNAQDRLGIINAMTDIMSGNLGGQEVRQLANAGGGGALILRELSNIAGGRDKISQLKVDDELFRELEAAVSKVQPPTDSMARAAETLNKAIQEVQIQLGTAMLPGIVEAARVITESIRNLDPREIKEVGEKFGELVKKVGELVSDEVLPRLAKAAMGAADALEYIIDNPIKSSIGAAGVVAGGAAAGKVAGGAAAGLGAKALGGLAGAGAAFGGAASISAFGATGMAALATTVLPIIATALIAGGIAMVANDIINNTVTQAEAKAARPASESMFEYLNKMVESGDITPEQRDARMAQLRAQDKRVKDAQAERAKQAKQQEIADAMEGIGRKQLKELEAIRANTDNFTSDLDATLVDIHDLRTRRQERRVQSEVMDTTITGSMGRLAGASAHAARRLKEASMTYAAL